MGVDLVSLHRCAVGGRGAGGAECVRGVKAEKEKARWV